MIQRPINPLLFAGGSNLSSLDETEAEKEARRRIEVLARWREMARGNGRNYSQGLLEILPPIAQAQVLGLPQILAVQEMQARQPRMDLTPVPGRLR